jgi:anthranilate synthase component 2
VILLVDNYDSFTHNLAHLFGELGAAVVVRRNDAPDLERLQPERLVVSPGPGRPPQRVVALLRATQVPTLGVCLGHQAIVEAFGGEVGPARELVPIDGVQFHPESVLTPLGRELARNFLAA